MSFLLWFSCSLLVVNFHIIVKNRIIPFRFLLSIFTCPLLEKFLFLLKILWEAIFCNQIASLCLLHLTKSFLEKVLRSFAHFSCLNCKKVTYICFIIVFLRRLWCFHDNCFWIYTIVSFFNCLLVFYYIITYKYLIFKWICNYSISLEFKPFVKRSERSNMTVFGWTVLLNLFVSIRLGNLFEL